MSRGRRKERWKGGPPSSGTERDSEPQRPGGMHPASQSARTCPRPRGRCPHYRRRLGPVRPCPCPPRKRRGAYDVPGRRRAPLTFSFLILAQPSESVRRLRMQRGVLLVLQRPNCSRPASKVLSSRLSTRFGAVQGVARPALPMDRSTCPVRVVCLFSDDIRTRDSGGAVAGSGNARGSHDPRRFAGSSSRPLLLLLFSGRCQGVCVPDSRSTSQRQRVPVRALG